MLNYFLLLLVVAWNCKGAEGIRNVELIVPPLVRAGGTATMLCLFDLEGSPLYSVKWYRGQYEFFRYIPTESPPSKVFQISGIYVDVYASNRHQVTLHNLPTYVSGEISCEITTDAPAFSTVCVSKRLKIENLSIDLIVAHTEYQIGQQLLAECAASTPAKIAFYVNSLRIPIEYVYQDSPNIATLNLTLTSELFSTNGVLRLQCSGGISDQYYISTKNVNITKKTSTVSLSSTGSTMQPWKVILLLIGVLYLLSL